MNIHHFYHIYADGSWQDPVREHITAMKRNGFYESLTNFSIGMVGTPERCSEVKAFLYNEGISYNLCGEEQTGWEQVTQIPMWEFSQTNDGLILYAHSKGASNPSDVNIRWRRSMIYWNVIRWKDCIEKLKDHDAVGCHWIQPLIQGMPEHIQGNFMFAGTFFWSKCAQVRTWIKPPLTHRHEAEGWIGYGWHAKRFPVYDFTPYFPNTGSFMDDWGNNHPVNGKSYV